MCLDAQFAAVHVLSYGNILHLFGDDAFLCQSHLRLSWLSLGYPWLTELRQSFLKVDIYSRVAVRTAGVVDIHWGIVAEMLLALFYCHRRRKRHLAHAHLQFGMDDSIHIDLFRTGISYFYVIVHSVGYL